MSQFKRTLEESGVLRLVGEAKGEGKGERIICCSGFSEEDSCWNLTATDGADVWRLSLNEQELRERAAEKGHAVYLRDLKLALEGGGVRAIRGPAHLQLHLAGSSELTLVELLTSQRQSELWAVTAGLWDCLRETRTRLRDSERQLDIAKTQQLREQPVFADVSLPSTRSATSKPKRPAGASLVNPTSKRRKAATGVVFGEDS